jgi:hypothetical protein
MTDPMQEFYDDPNSVLAYQVYKNDDGSWTCWEVFAGPWNVEITVGEEQDQQKHRSDQEYYQWLYENKQRVVS